MKRSMPMLFAMAFIVCIAIAQSGMAGTSEKKACDDKWDENKYCDYCDHNCEGQCTCAESDHGPECGDKDGKEHCGECRCDKCNMKEPCDKCGDKHFDKCCNEGPVFEHCNECGSVYCDGRCEKCEEKCCVYEYCPNCGVKYAVEHADGYCDNCGMGCYCIEKCDKCGYSHYFNGYCDECGAKCFYSRCCDDSFDKCHKCDKCGKCDKCDKCRDSCRDQAPRCSMMPEKCDKCMEKRNYSDDKTETFTIFLGDEDYTGGHAPMQGGYPVRDSMEPKMDAEYADQTADQTSPGYPPAPAEEAHAS